MSDYRVPDWNYVVSLRNELQWEMHGFHTKVTEIEALKHYEEDQQLPRQEEATGQKVRIGLTADLIENVKAAILANAPTVRVKNLRKNKDAEGNASRREHYWQDHLNKLFGGNNTPNYVAELCDAQMLGMGVFKSARSTSKWDVKARKRKRGESSADHVDRVNALKRYWGHPTSQLTVHPLSLFIRPGVGSEIDEIIEHSYKAKRTVYKSYDLTDASLDNNTVATIPGQPDSWVRSLPAGIDSSNYVLVTEYWNPECYQVYVNGQLVYNEEGDEVSVCYFFAPGRLTSSKDPDKYAVSVAENLRHNEPVINRMLTRMVEALDLIVNKRLTLEVPEGYTGEVDVVDNEDGSQVERPRTWTFNEKYSEALPPGAKIVDPYQGANNAYLSMPMVQLLMQITAQHGVNPLFKGVSPGAAGSGYRDNSLYLMAKQTFMYLIASLQGCLTAYIIWQERILSTQIKQECWSGEYSLKPGDITDWPADISVELRPSLPQNLIAEGEFWARQQALGNVSRKYVREHGLGIEQPNEMEDETDLEQLKELLKPYLLQDVIGTVLGKGDLGAEPTTGPDGIPVASQEAMMQRTSAGSNGAGREVGREVAGHASGGQPKQPVVNPGEVAR